MPDRNQNGSTPTSWLHVAGFIVVLWAVASDAMAQVRDVLVTEVRGTAVRNAVKGVTPVRALDNLKAGDRIRLSSDSHLSLFASSDALLYTVDGPAEVVVGPKGITANGKPASSSKLDEAYRNVKVNAPELVQGSLVMRGAQDLRIESPEGVVSQADARRFKWRGNASAWILEIANDAGDLVYRAEVKGNEHDLPTDVVLQPGKTLVWGLARVGVTGALADWTEFTIGPAIPERADKVVHAAWLREQGMPRAAVRTLQPLAAR